MQAGAVGVNLKFLIEQCLFQMKYKQSLKQVMKSEEEQLWANRMMEEEPKYDANMAIEYENQEI